MDPTTLVARSWIDEIAKKYGDGVAVAVVFGLILLGTLVFITLVFMAGRRAHRKRRLRREAWGAKYGLKILESEESGKKLFLYSMTAEGDRVLKEYPYVYLFKTSTAMAMHILEGEVDGLPVRVFEYQYTTGSGRTTMDYHFSVVAFQYPANKGYTGLVRGSRRAGLPKEDIETGHPVFDGKFHVYADEWGLLKNELPPEVENVIVNGMLSDFVMAGDRLVIITPKRLKDDQYDEFFRQARYLAAWMATKN